MTNDPASPLLPYAMARLNRLNEDKAAEIVALKAIIAAHIETITRLRAEFAAVRSVCESAETGVISYEAAVDIIHDFAVEVLAGAPGEALTARATEASNEPGQGSSMLSVSAARAGGQATS